MRSNLLSLLLGHLQSKPVEQAGPLEVIKTDNKVFNKVMTVFVSLCQEVEDLCAEGKTKFYPPLLLYVCGGPRGLALPRPRGAGLPR